jgi:tetratricopeptide (TPR) repeat protein
MSGPRGEAAGPVVPRGSERAAGRDDAGAGDRPGPPAPSPRLPRSARGLFALAGLATFLVYLPSLGNGFVDWDDGKNLLDNLAYRGLGPAQLRWMWTTFHLGPYQPLSWMSYGADYLLWGMKPFGYHLTSILLHALSAALFAALAARLFAVGRRSDPGRDASREAWTAAAFGVLASLMWSLHPLRVEAVSWATERREVLCGVFTLTALLCHAAGRRLLVTAIFALAAMLSKGTAVVVPALLVLMDLHREAPALLREWPAAIGRSLRRLAPLFALSAVFGVVAVLGQKQAEAVAGLERLGLLDRLALLGNALGFYALRTILPVRLAPIYEMSSDLSTVRIGAAASVVLLAAAGVAIAWYPRLRSVLLLLVAYVVLVAPVGGLLQVGAQIAADRYAYAAGWALSLLVAGAASFALGGSRPGAAAPARAAAGALLAASALAGTPLALLTVRQQAVWHDSVALWTHQLEAYPDTAIAHYSLARLRVTNEPGEASDRWAEPHYREALRVRPDYADAYRGLANSLRRLGRRDEAMRVYQDGLRVAPRSGPLLYGLAIAEWESGREEDAIAHLRELSETPPVTADSSLVLARALAAHGDAPGAVAAYERAMAAPTDSPAVAPMELAWLLATNPDPRVRDGARAVALARQAVDLGRELEARGGLALRSGLTWRLPRTLAASLAESGDYGGATATLRQSAPLYPPERKTEIDAWLAAFARREPVRAEPGFP